jgi:hypothetical protein
MKYFSLVSKTAGTSIRNSLKQSLPTDEFLIIEGSPSTDESVMGVLESDMNFFPQ